MAFRSWKVVEKTVKRHERGDGNYLILIVEEVGGILRREAVVSGYTFHRTSVGDTLQLPGLDIDELRTKSHVCG